MLKLFVLAIVVRAITAELEAAWTVFKAKYNKTYDPKMDSIRKHIWKENLKYIEEHNKLYSLGNSSYYLGENEYADMTNSEFVSIMNGFRPRKNCHFDDGVEFNATILPHTVDWRKEGYVTGVKNQRYCGSCWAFSATGAIEGQHFRKTGKLVSLSESNLNDCSWEEGNQGCHGGEPYSAFQYVIDNNGIDTEASYPYAPVDNMECHFNEQGIGATIFSYKVLPDGSESALREAVSKIGPISVCIDASHLDFQQYKGGVYDNPDCSTRNLDHCVLAVGYGVHTSIPYWLVKNSWGKKWGMEGYIMMSRNKDNQCGIASSASYPIV